MSATRTVIAVIAVCVITLLTENLSVAISVPFFGGDEDEDEGANDNVEEVATEPTDHMNGTLFGIDMDLYVDADVAGIQRMKDRKEEDGVIYYWGDSDASKFQLGSEWDPYTKKHDDNFIQQFLHGVSEDATLNKFREVVGANKGMWKNRATGRYGMCVRTAVVPFAGSDAHLHVQLTMLNNMVGRDNVLRGHTGDFFGFYGFPGALERGDVDCITWEDKCQQIGLKQVHAWLQYYNELPKLPFDNWMPAWMRIYDPCDGRWYVRPMGWWWEPLQLLAFQGAGIDFKMVDFQVEKFCVPSPCHRFEHDGERYPAGVCVAVRQYPCLCNHKRGPATRFPLAQGWTGRFCEADLCRPDPINDPHQTVCLNGGVCYYGYDPTSFMCDCPIDWTGKFCERERRCTDVQPFPCDVNNAISCQNTASQRTSAEQKNVLLFSCQCKDGYHGTYCEAWDMCKDDPCENGGTCNPSGECNPTLLGVEFNDVPDGNTFVNGSGNTGCPDASYFCVCPDGWVGAHCTKKQDEVFDPLNLCSPNPCQNDGVCTSSFLEDVYNCKCTAGFDGDHCEIDTCESNPCLNGGTCIGRPQGYVCECTEFFYGINCDNSVLSVNCPPAASIPCSIEEWYNAGPRHCSPHPNDTSLAVRQQECQEMFLDDLNVTSTDQLTADDQNKYHMVQCCFKQCNGFYCTILEP